MLASESFSWNCQRICLRLVKNFRRFFLEWCLNVTEIDSWTVEHPQEYRTMVHNVNWDNITIITEVVYPHVVSPSWLGIRVARKTSRFNNNWNKNGKIVTCLQNCLLSENFVLINLCWSHQQDTFYNINNKLVNFNIFFIKIIYVSLVYSKDHLPIPLSAQRWVYCTASMTILHSLDDYTAQPRLLNCAEGNKSCVTGLLLWIFALYLVLS